MNVVVVGVLVTLALHFTWEMLQAPAFDDFAESMWAGTVRCFVAALGDVLIAAGAYGVTAVAIRSATWPLRAHWIVPAATATWIGVGVIATIIFEHWALARGRWAYGPEMPLVFGVGLLPLLQWFIVPMLTLGLMRHLSRRWFSSDEQGGGR